MNYFNNLLDNSIKQNLVYVLAATSALYLTKSTYSLFTNMIAVRNENKTIRLIIENELSKLSPEIINNSKYNLTVSLYFKIINLVYKKELSNYDIKRREIFESDNIEKYISYVQDYLKSLKLFEENIFKIIYDVLNIDATISDVENSKPENYDIE